MKSSYVTQNWLNSDGQTYLNYFKMHNFKNIASLFAITETSQLFKKLNEHLIFSDWK